MTRWLSIPAAAASLAVPFVVLAGWLRWGRLRHDATTFAQGQHPANTPPTSATHLAVVHELHRIDTEADQ